MTLDARLRFDNFVVGSANRLAVAAARAVADAPGTVYSPLFIYSSSGLGKPHLMGAIGNQIRQRTPEATVEYVTLDGLMEELHAAITRGEIATLRERYQRLDAILIDDVQFLTGRTETQSEVLRLLNALQGAGRQIVMASDRPPSEIADVDERVVTRLSGGLIVDIGPPEYETRTAILRSKCDERGVRFRGGVVEELGRLAFSNVRELQGALNRLIAAQTLGDTQIGPDDVLTVLGDLAEARALSPARAPAGDEFASFLTEIASAVAQQVEPWKARIAEAIAYWSAEGYLTTSLDRALQEGEPSRGVEVLLREYDDAVRRLRELARQAADADPSLATHEAFVDPDRVNEAEDLLARALRAAAPLPGPSQAFTRAGFEVSSSNQLAVRAADAVVAAPGVRYNPLFIHGPSGVGKTHLLHAIGNGLAARNGAHVACMAAQDFVDELIAALQGRDVDRWRASLRRADALLLDDVQFLAGKERTQEELFHAFNALHAEGKQLIFASDAPPRALAGFEDRLRSRFEGGLVVEMLAPDKVLRERLVTRFVRAAGQAPQAELVAYLAERPAASVREVIGTVNRLVAAAEMAGAALTAGFARGELEPDARARAAPSAAAAGADTFFLDEEKLVWEWPEPLARLIEEAR